MTSTLCLPPRIDGDEAVRRFARRRLTNLYGLLVQPVRVASNEDPDTKTLPFVERLWMPAYAVQIRAALGNTHTSVWTSVDGWAGQCSLLDCHDELELREVLEDCFPPRIQESEASELARTGLLRYTLSQRGQRGRPVPEAVEEIRLYHFPLWILYYRRFGKYVDLKVLDGYSGTPAGAKMRVAVLNALVAARKSGKDAEGSS